MEDIDDELTERTLQEYRKRNRLSRERNPRKAGDTKQATRYMRKSPNKILVSKPLDKRGC